MTTPAFSQAWIKADPASIETFLPSMVSSTSAALGVVEANVRSGGALAYLAALAADHVIRVRSIVAEVARDEEWRIAVA